METKYCEINRVPHFKYLGEIIQTNGSDYSYWIGYEDQESSGICATLLQ